MSELTAVAEFVKQYKIALKHKWTREQFATFIGCAPDSVRRKIGKVNVATGLVLELLPLGDGTPLTDAQIIKFKQQYNEVTETSKGAKRTGKRFVITSAQNATPVDMGFLNSLLTFCSHNDAELMVIPYRYKNPTSIWSHHKDDDTWVPAVLPYLCDQKTVLSDTSLQVLGHIKITPTATDPLSGFEAYTGGNSSILGHPKVQFRSVPTMNGKPKIMLTTGTITKPNYTDSKTGWKGNFHHSIAAVVVEIDDDGDFHVRHIHATGRSGAFYDLDKYYTPTEVTSGHRVAGLITGDTHAEFIDEVVENVTFHNTDSMVAILNPKNIILHDLCDFYARNHHHRGNDLIGYGKHMFGRDNVQDGLQEAADFIDRISTKDMNVVIVKSNHDEAFDRWLREADVRHDHENAPFFYYMKYHQLTQVTRTPTGFKSFDPFKFWCLNPENGNGLQNVSSTRFLSRDESFKLHNVEIGFHGDVGINGSRGDIKSLSKLSDKMVIGHSHSPGIYEGCYQVGLSAQKNLEYKRGPSSWMQTHCLVYPDGKRTLINIINGKWKA